MQGVEERRLKRTSVTLQGEAIEDNAADDILMVDQGRLWGLITSPHLHISREWD
jgi:hypothetical protein